MGQLRTDTQSEGASRKENVVRLWSHMFSCERSIEQRLRSHLSASFSITLPQFKVLCELDRNDAPVVMSRLSEQLNVTSSNITGVIRRLERDGLVKRFRSGSHTVTEAAAQGTSIGHRIAEMTTDASGQTIQ
jgi:GTP-sensing pleiotropic transcriptional regulator CodY